MWKYRICQPFSASQMWNSEGKKEKWKKRSGTYTTNCHHRPRLQLRTRGRHMNDSNRRKRARGTADVQSRDPNPIKDPHSHHHRSRYHRLGRSVQSLPDNMTPLGIGKSVILTVCHIIRWLSRIYRGPLWDSKNCHIKQMSYYPVSYYPGGSVQLNSSTITPYSEACLRGTKFNS